MSCKHRLDIDGLRAIAVIFVILFHLNKHWLSGGFIGVDVFFVISGFLITKIIYSEITENKFNFSRFYRKRINRIIPVFFVVIFSSYFFAWYLLYADEFLLFTKSMVSAALFCGNIFFAVNTGGYFDLSSNQMPLLHTWSLSVEEQFYIIFPFILISLVRVECKYNIKITLPALIVMALSSFALAQISPSYSFLIKYNYYSLITGRAGELLIGSIAGIYSLKRERFKYGYIKLDEVASITGFTLILLSAIFLSEKIQFPSFISVIPTIGTALILYFHKHDTIISKILSMYPITFIGRISYSLYLWHWPVIVFYKLYADIDRIKSPSQYITIVFITFTLSLLSYYLVETPARKSKKNTCFSIKFFYMTPLLLVFSLYLIQTRTEIIKKFRGNELIHRTWVGGESGFLFLGDAYDKTIRKLELKITPSKDDITSTVNDFNNITSVASKLSVATALFIGPNKSSIYSSKLPASIKKTNVRYIDSYIEALSKNKDLIVYDPTNELIKESKLTSDILYYRTDTHWNSKGAYIAYNDFLKKLGFPRLNISFKNEEKKPGDLISISKISNFKLYNGDNFSPIINTKNITCNDVFEARDPFGVIQNCFNPNAPVNKRVWIIGDSFNGALRVYFKETFKEVDFLGHWSKQLDLLPKKLSDSKIKPDMIVIIRVERSF